MLVGLAVKEEGAFQLLVVVVVMVVGAFCSFRLASVEFRMRVGL
jgi:hypothetical protein